MSIACEMAESRFKIKWFAICLLMTDGQTCSFWWAGLKDPRWVLWTPPLMMLALQNSPRHPAVPDYSHLAGNRSASEFLPEHFVREGKNKSSFVITNLLRILRSLLKNGILVKSACPEGVGNRRELAHGALWALLKQVSQSPLGLGGDQATASPTTGDSIITSARPLSRKRAFYKLRCYSFWAFFLSKYLEQWSWMNSRSNTKYWKKILLVFWGFSLVNILNIFTSSRSVYQC